MGYRSNVTALFYAVGTEKEAALLKLFMDENFPEETASLQPLRWFSVGDYHGYAFELEDVKWYDSYPEVAEFNKLVATLRGMVDKEGGHPWAFEFVRVGEDETDVERDGFGMSAYLLNVVRHIECSV